MRTSLKTPTLSRKHVNRPFLGIRASRLLRHQVLAAFTLVDGQGRATTYAKHALIVQKGKQTFLKPLVGESVLDDSRSWKDGVQLRPGVMYVLASGCRLAFGTEAQAFTIQFEEGAGSNPLVEMMVKGMMANSSPEVKKALGGDK